jgi:hypothetical protein
MINVDSLEWRNTQALIESQIDAAKEELAHERDAIVAAELRGAIAGLRGLIERVTQPAVLIKESDNQYQT